MKNRHIKRWCDDCKMNVFAHGHGHGQSAGARQGELVAKGDADRAFDVASARFYAAKEAARADGQRIVTELLKGHE